MNKEKQIEEMTKNIYDAPMLAPTLWQTCNKIATHLYNAGYRKQSEGEWIERADLQGFVCSNGCGELLTELEEDATLPKFCPNCGTKMKNGATIHEHVELLCKRLGIMKGGTE